MTRTPRILATSLALMLGLVLTLGAFGVVRGFVAQEASLRAQQVFQRDFAHHLVLLEKAVEGVLGQTRALASLYEASDHVDQGELERFVAGLSPEPAVKAHGACVVEGRGGCRLVQQVLGEGLTDFPGATDGVLALHAGDGRGLEVHELDHGMFLVHASLPSVQEPGAWQAVLAFDAAELGRSALAMLETDTAHDSTLVVRDEGGAVLFVHPEGVDVDGPLSFEPVAVEVGHLTWWVAARPTNPPPVPEQWLPLLVLGCGLALTALVAGWVALLTGQTATVSHLVDARTEQLVATSRELRANEALLRAIVETTVDGILVFDRSGRIQSGNPAASQIFGYAHRALLGRTIFDLLPEPHRRNHREALDRFLATGDAPLLGERREVAGRRPDGTIFPMDLTVTELHTTEGRRFMAVVADVSQRRLVDRLKGEFLSTVNHELRTPLTSIIGSLELLRDGLAGPLSDRGQRFADLAYENSERLLRIVNDILDMERLGSGHVELSRRPLDALELIEKAVAMHEGLAEHRQARLAVAGGLMPVDVLGDPDRLMQVLANLISNAVRFSPPDGTVTVGVDEQDGEALFWVQDEGPGIPEAFRDQVFVPFSQADGSDSRHVGGTGLGLSIARAIVEAHNGVIWFDTAEGEGTTFLFRIPQPALPGTDEVPMDEEGRDEDTFSYVSEVSR